MNSLEFHIMRQGLGLSDSAIASVCGVSEGDVQEWCLGKSAIPKKAQTKLFALSEALFIKAHDYVCDEVNDIGCNALVFFQNDQEYTAYCSAPFAHREVYHLWLWHIIQKCRSVCVEYEIIAFDIQDYEAYRETEPSPSYPLKIWGAR